MLQIVSEPGWCYVVTLSATGGPATAVLPAPLQHQQPGLVSQPDAEGPGAAPPGNTGSNATGEHSLSNSAGPDSQAPVGLANNSASNTAESEHSSRAIQPIVRDGYPDGEKTLHSTLAGMSLGGAHAQASEPAQAGIERHGQSTETSFDDPLRRGQRPVAQQGVQEGSGASHVRAAESAVDLPLFTGFVSHEQLEAAIGSTSYERRLATSKELTHWVKMRGPGMPSSCKPQVLTACTESGMLQLSTEAHRGYHRQDDKVMQCSTCVGKFYHCSAANLLVTIWCVSTCLQCPAHPVQAEY